MRIWNSEIINKAGEEVELAGWVNARRDHGKLVFIDLRDRSGISQLVFNPQNLKPDLYKIAESLRPEWVIEIKGRVKTRPKGMENKELLTGEYEIEVTKFNVLSGTGSGIPIGIETRGYETINIETDGYETSEEFRMRNRYLDLRRRRLQNNLRARAKIIKFIRDFLTEKDFVEVETPILTKSTPEGARDYLVPSRLEAGKFYALPQSPQQYKQLLMVAGLERYFQIAKCFRDEDTRGDRQPEFTQLDLEMSFVKQEDVMQLNEDLLISLISECYPNKHIQEVPFPRLTYKEAIKKFGTDRPDLREDKNNPDLLSFVWIVDFPFFKRGDNGNLTFTHNPFSAFKPEYQNVLIDSMSGEKVSNFADAISSQYDIVLNGLEIGGGSIRNNSALGLIRVFQILGYSKQQIVQDFSHMVNAFLSGVPPHGGIAWGLDRFVMILQNEPNIREVIAFPKTGDGRDLMMGAPSEVDNKQLKELHIEITKPKKSKK